MQAMILAAGLGTRLRPLTDSTPKCLVRVDGRPLIDYHLSRMASLGVTDVTVNTSYLAEQVMDYCGDGSRYGVSIHYSHEPDKPLGAIGGIRLAMTRGLKGQFLLVSADIWADLQADHPFFQSPSKTRLLLVPNPSYYPQGDFGIGEHEELSLQPPLYTYAGFAILHTDSLTDNPEAKSIAALVTPFIQQGCAESVLYKEYHANVGTLEDLEEANRVVKSLHS